MSVSVPQGLGLRLLGGAFVITLSLLAVEAAQAASGSISPTLDPGPRSGPAAAGGPLPGLGPDELKFFRAAKAQFITIDSVTGAIDGESGSGLGPRYNGNVCSACHIH